LDGNPLGDVNDLLKVVTTIKGGRIVSDVSRRSAQRPGAKADRR